MKILFLSHYFPPEVNAPATRTYEHCKYWVEQGHEVTVLSCVPHHPMGEAYPGYSNKWWHEENIDGIRAIKLKTYITANEGFIKRTWNYIFYMLMVIAVAPFIAKADVVISTSPQFFNGLAGYFVSRIKRTPWILEVRDLWPESILAVGAIKNRWVIAALEYIERFVYRKADHIVPVTQAFAKHIACHGGSEESITVIRNGVNLDLFSPGVRDESLASEWGLREKFVAAYVGTHGMAHGLDTIMHAADCLRDKPNIAFLMVGAGAERENLLALKQRMQLDNVIMIGQQPKESMPAIWSITDVSLVLLRKLNLFKTVIPSKIFESMAMETPILLGVEGESRDIIESGGVGLPITPESGEELAAAVAKLYSDTSLYRQIQGASRSYVAKNFDRKVLAERFLGVIDEVVSSDTA